MGETGRNEFNCIAISFPLCLSYFYIQYCSVSACCAWLFFSYWNKKQTNYILENHQEHCWHCATTLSSTTTLILDQVDESGVQSKDASTPSGNTKVMGKPAVPTAGGPQHVTSPNPIVQRLPAFLDNHNYAKSPMQVRGEVCWALY